MNSDTNSRVVVDSNLLIAVLNAQDPTHADSVELATALSDGGYELIAPVLYLWELDAYLRHPEKSKKHLQTHGAKFRISTHDITNGLYTRTYDTTMVAIKGADRVFVSLAKDQGVPLITNDRQILKHAATLGVQAVSVTDFLAKFRP